MKQMIHFILYITVALCACMQNIQAFAHSIECNGTIVSSINVKSGIDIFFEINPNDYEEKTESFKIYVYGDNENFFGNLKFSKSGNDIVGVGLANASTTKEVLVSTSITLELKALQSAAGSKFKAKGDFVATNYTDESQSTIEIVYKYNDILLNCKTK